MLSGHAIGLHDHDETDRLSSGPASDIDEVDEEAEMSGKILYQASFEELGGNFLQYDTVIWILISLPLVLAWGIGALMLLYLPFRRYVLRKDISSRKLYVTPDEIVYKVVRPSFLPFMGIEKVENRIPLHLIIDIIIEQGCLQAVYGIHTVRIENIAHRKAAPLDELHVQGVFNPSLLRKVSYRIKNILLVPNVACRKLQYWTVLVDGLRALQQKSQTVTKVIVAEASKSIQEVGYQKSKFSVEGDSVRMGSRGMSTPRRYVSSAGMANIYTPQAPDMGGTTTANVLLHKLEEVKLSIKNIEQFVAGQQSSTEIKDC